MFYTVVHLSTLTHHFFIPSPTYPAHSTPYAVIPHTRHPVQNPGLHKQRGEIPPSTVQHKQQSGTADSQGSTNPAAAGDPVADDQSRDISNILPSNGTETAVQQNHDNGAIEHDSNNLGGTQQFGAINPEVQHNNNQVMMGIYSHLIREFMNSVILPV